MTVHDLDAKLWAAADKLRNNLDAEPQDCDDTSQNTFWVPHSPPAGVKRYARSHLTMPEAGAYTWLYLAGFGSKA